MGQPLYALLIAQDPEMRQAILNGKIHSVIRAGHQEYPYIPYGKVMLCCHVEPWVVMADIINVRHTIIHAITLEECLAAGYNSLGDLLLEMQKFYPDLSINPFTIAKPGKFIRWTCLIILPPMSDHYS